VAYVVEKGFVTVEFWAKESVAESRAANLALGECDQDDILDYQLRPWRGKGMAIRIYSKEKCPVCGKAFNPNNGLRCDTHKKLRPVSCFIQVSGVKDYPSNRIRIYSDKDDNPLFVKTVFSVADQIRREIDHGIFDPKSYLPVNKNRLIWKNYAGEYLDHMRNRAFDRPYDSDDWMSKSAYDELEKYQRLYLIPHFGELEINELRTFVIENFIAGLKNQKGKYASATIRKKCVDGTRHMLNFARKRGDIIIVPEMPVVKKVKKSLTTLIPEQQREILQHIPGERCPIFEWLMETGRRINEARAMKVRDINFSKGEYYVTGAFDKNTYKPFPKIQDKSGATLPLNERTVEILKNALKDRIYGPDDYVFINPKNGFFYNYNEIGKILMQGRKKAEYDVELNEFGRHSWATQRLSEGWSYDQVAAFLLNTAAVVEKNYTNVDVAVRKSIINLHERARKKASDRR